MLYVGHRRGEARAPTHLETAMKGAPESKRGEKEEDRRSEQNLNASEIATKHVRRRCDYSDRKLGAGAIV